MSEYVVLVEADLRSGNTNYRIRRSEALPQAEAQMLFDRVIRGEVPKLLKAKNETVLVRTADNQVCRFWPGLIGIECMDRVTLAPVIG